MTEQHAANQITTALSYSTANGLSSLTEGFYLDGLYAVMHEEKRERTYVQITLSREKKTKNKRGAKIKNNKTKFFFQKSVIMFPALDFNSVS